MGFVCGSSALATLTPPCPQSLARALPVAQRRSLCVFLSFSSVRTNAMTRRWQMHTESLDAALADRLIETAEKMHQSREASFSFASEVEQVRQLCARVRARVRVYAHAPVSLPLSPCLSPPLFLFLLVCGCVGVRSCVRACVCVCVPEPVPATDRQRQRREGSGPQQTNINMREFAGTLTRVLCFMQVWQLLLSKDSSLAQLSGSARKRAWDRCILAVHGVDRLGSVRACVCIRGLLVRMHLPTRLAQRALKRSRVWTQARRQP